MEDLKLGGLLAGADEFNRDTGNGLDRKGGAAAGVAVEFGEDEPRELEGLVEGFGNVNRFLA